MLLNQIITILFFIVILIIAFIYLKPLRLHNTYKYSTLTLKISYLIYLIVALTTAYMFMFFRNKTMFNYDFSFTSSFMYPVLVFLILGFVLPTLGILIRRKVAGRQQYNILFSGINFGYILFMLSLVFISKWTAVVLQSQ